MLCLIYQSHILRETIAELNQPIQEKFSPSHIVTNNGDFMISSIIIYCNLPNIQPPFPLTLLQVCPAARPLRPEQPNTIMAARHGTGHANRDEGWGQLEDLAVTAQGLGTAWSWWGTWSLVLGDRTAMLLLACLLPALGKGTDVVLNSKSTPAKPGSHSSQGAGVEHSLWQDCRQGLCLAWWVTATHSDSPERNGTLIMEMSQIPHCNFLAELKPL